MRLYDETCVALCEGQYLDIWMAEHDDGLSVELYFDMIGRKTAALIAASIEAGAVLATDDEAVIDALPRLRLGPRASPSSSTTTCSASGARSARPARSRPTSPRKKKTLPVIYAFEHAHAEPTGRASPSSTRTAASLPEHVAEIVAILERTGAREYTRDQARLHRDRALAALDAAGTIEREPRERLEEIVRSVISA